MKIVIASQNVHKIREFRFMLREYKGLDVLSLLNFPSYSPVLPVDQGSSLESLAVWKAKEAARELKEWVIADSTGLIVPALGGKPGVESASYAGVGATDKDNRKKLLKDMTGITDLDRQAYFECWMAISSPYSLEKVVQGLCEGTILWEERGNKGFGYDSLFIKHEYGKSFAQIEELIKNRISHRRKAFDKLTSTLKKLDEEALLI